MVENKQKQHLARLGHCLKRTPSRTQRLSPRPPPRPSGTQRRSRPTVTTLYGSDGLEEVSVVRRPATGPGTLIYRQMLKVGSLKTMSQKDHQKTPFGSQSEAETYCCDSSKVDIVDALRSCKLREVTWMERLCRYFCSLLDTW